ncbi:MAG: hypothetical protein A07HB70_01018 [uncultured archaeon A07HB70]|nr:MAG: hypothetical protein A07HB70_01018 [uncultured archaeon A07HB70]
MRTAPRLPALLAVATLLLAGVSVAPVATAGQPGLAPSALSGGPAAAFDAPENTTIEVRLYTNASARWTVRTTYLLEDEAEESAFREYAAAYRDGETDAGPRADPFAAAVDRAGAATDREMRLTNVSREGRVDGGVGVVAVSFHWTGFLGRGENETLRLDEALALGGDRTWLGSLTGDQVLVVRTPSGYSIVDSSGPSFDAIENNAIRFEGPREFESRLTVTYRQTGPATPERPDRSLPWGLFGGGVLVVAAAAVLYVRLRGRGGQPAPTADDDPRADGAAADPEPTGESDGADESEDEDEAESEPDPELLADDERVERLLEQNDGRMKQAAIVEETGWSDAKVSQLLSSMADEGQVEKLRLGRENLISLPDDDEPG